MPEPLETTPRAIWRKPWDEIIRSAAHGMTDKQIAQQLGLAVSTVDYHWRQMRRELGVTTRTEAVVRGLRTLADSEGQALRAHNDELQQRLGEAILRRNELEQRLAAERTHHVQAIRQWQAELRQSDDHHQEYHRMLMSANTTGTILYRMQNGPPYTCRYVSDSIQRYGYRAADFVSGKVNLFDILDDEDAHTLLSHGVGLATKASRRAMYTYRLKCADGRRVWMLDQNTEIDTDQGPRTDYVGVAVEIEELVLAGQLKPLERVAWWPPSA